MTNSSGIRINSINWFYLLFFVSLFLPSNRYLALIGALYWIPFLFKVVSNWELVKTKGSKFIFSPEIMLLGALGIYAFCSLAWSQWDKILFLKEAVRIFCFFGLISLFFTIHLSEKNKIHLNTLLPIVGLSSGYILTNAVLKLYSYDGHISYEIMQQSIVVGGIFFHHSPVAWLQSFGILAVIYCFFNSDMSKSRNFLEVIKLFLLAILFSSVFILAQSRGAIIGLVAGLLLYSFLQRSIYSIFVVVLLLLISLLSLILYIYYDNTLIDSLIERGMESRFHIYENAFLNIRENIIFGHGFGTSSQNTIYNDAFLAMHYHSIYLSTLYYGGVLAFIILVATIVNSFALNYKINENTIWCVIFLMSCVILVFDGNHVIDYPSVALYIFVMPILIMLSNRLRQIEGRPE